MMLIYPYVGLIPFLLNSIYFTYIDINLSELVRCLLIFFEPFMSTPDLVGAFLIFDHFILSVRKATLVV